jgi:hypothetical protein
MIDNHSNCEHYEPLISAMIDGELESDERNELNSHLQNCARCKQRVVAFEQVDAAVGSLALNSAGNNGSPNSPTPYSFATAPFAMLPPKSAPRRNNKRVIWRLIPLAIAATLLICLGIVAWPNPQPANAGQISPAQIVEPMKELHLLNQIKQRDQNVMLQTLVMDLRSMKLEIDLLEPGSTERVGLTAQIDAMIEKVKLFETKNETESD